MTVFCFFFCPSPLLHLLHFSAVFHSFHVCLHLHQYHHHHYHHQDCKNIFSSIFFPFLLCSPYILSLPFLRRFCLYHSLFALLLPLSSFSYLYLIFSFSFIIIIMLFLSCLQNKSHLDPHSNYTTYSYHTSISHLTYYLPQSATVD